MTLTPRKRKMKKQLDYQKKKIKSLQAKNLYLKKKVARLEDILQSLDEKALINKEEKMVLERIGVEEAELLKRQIKKSKSGKLSREKYSPELRCFALTLNFYSPQAYKYVRKTFETCLPAPRTLTKWYSNIDGRPGFTKEALSALKYKADANPDGKIYCTLVFDEMKIKAQSYGCTNSGRQFGYVDYGFDLLTDNTEEATDVLVFLLVGINVPWKVPIGYFLVKGTSAKLKAQLVTKAFELVHETGVEIKALTCDGARANLAMATELGCCLVADKLQTTILDPTTGQRVYFFLDPSHMLKLVRNTFCDYRCFYDGNGNKIQWSFVEALHKIQEKELFFMANKLRANHIYFKTKIMNVRLAAQLFSASVAEALSFCEIELDMSDFDGATPTSKFISLINDVFDILDSRSRQNGNKKALNSENFETAYKIMDEARNVLMSLSAYVKNRNGESRKMKLIDSPRYTGFLGLLVCIESTKSIFQDLIQNQQNSLKYMPLHRISQDHIELFFSIVRSHGGYSNNPSSSQFEAIYKKILVNTELTQTGSGTNCIPLEKITILNCTSALDRINSSTVRQYDASDDEVNFTNFTDNLIEEIEALTFLSPFAEKIIQYIAGYVVFSTSKKIKCQTCIKGLLGPIDNNSLIYKKSRGKLLYASEEVILLCRLCEKEIRKCLNDDNKPTRSCTTRQIVPRVLKRFIGKDFFSFISYHSHENDFTNHNLELARLIMKKYTDTRISFLMKKSNPQKCMTSHIYKIDSF